MPVASVRSRSSAAPMGVRARHPARTRPEEPLSLHAEVLRVQRTAGNAAVVQALRGSHPLPVQRGLRDWLRGKGSGSSPPGAPAGGQAPAQAPGQGPGQAPGQAQAPAPGGGGGGVAVQAPPAPAPNPLKVAFDKAVSNTTKLSKVRPAYSGATMDARRAIWTDDALMAKAKTALTTADWVQLMADLGVYHGGGSVAHTSAKDADTAIRADLQAYVGKAVKAGRKVEGSVMVLSGQAWLDAYYHEFPDELPRGGPTDDEADTNAFTTTSDPKNVIVLNKDKGNPGTTVHEGLHLYQNNTVLSKCGNNFNEGLTELLTRKVTTGLGIVRSNYASEYKAMAKLQEAVGEKALAEAYFDGKLGGLQKAFIAFRVGKGDSKKAARANWDKLVGHYRSGEYRQARALCQ